MKQVVKCMLLVCAAVNGASAASPEPPRSTTLQWRMSLDAQGHVTSLLPKGDGVEALRARLQEVVQTWEFVPGMADGKPAPTDTLLSVRVALTPSSDGDSYAVALEDVRTGGYVSDDRKAPPRFPPSELRRMAGSGIKVAQVAIEVGYDASGKVVEMQVTEGSKSQPEVLIKAVMNSLSEWRYEPERVAGVGVPGTLVVPVCFTLAQSSAESRKLANACRWTLPGSRAYVEEGQSLALDSQVKLKSEVAGRAL